MTTHDREYLVSHPWITFDADKQLRQAPPQLWQLVGGAVALIEVLADTPTLPEYASKMREVYLARGALATTAIEGNTLTEAEVLQLLEGQLRLPPSKEYLAVEVDNMIDAFNEIMPDVDGGIIYLPLTSERIKDMNRQVLKGLDLEPGVVPGEISEKGVVVGPYRGAPRRDCDYLLDRLCEWLEHGVPSSGQDTISTAILRAILAHLYLAWIHPFGDGNGRTARLVEFQILAVGGVPAPAAHLLSNHFNDTRTEYYRQLAVASRSGGNVVPFLVYALQGLYDGVNGQLDTIRGQTEELVWRRLVDMAIPGDGDVVARKRRLAVALYRARRVVQTKEMPTLNAKMQAAYLTRTSKTLTRDIHALQEKGLIIQVSRGNYRVALDLIMGLLPPRAPLA